MLASLVLSPSIFDLNQDIDVEFVKKYSILCALMERITKHSLILQDNTEFIASEIKENINNIEQDDLRKKIKNLYKNICLNYSKKVNIINDFEGDLNQTCGIFISLLNKNNDANGIYYNCKCDGIDCTECLSDYCKLNNQVNLMNIEEIPLWTDLHITNYIFDKDDNIEDFKNNIFKSFIENTTKVIIYDEQISNLNRDASDIAENFKYNLEYWTDYFYQINKNIILNFYTTIKDRGNTYQTINKLNEFSEFIRQKYKRLDFNIKIVSEKLHERYFYSDRVIFSCDKGIDLLNNNGNTLVDHIHISILENNEANKIRKSLNKM